MGPEGHDPQNKGKAKPENEAGSEPKKKGWKDRLLSVPGFLAAAAATALVTWGVDFLATGLSTPQTPPVTVSVQTNDEQLPAFQESPIAAVIPAAGSRGPISPASCQTFYQQIRSGDAVPSPLLLQLVVQSDTPKAVLIEDMTIHIVSRRKPVAGVPVECAPQGLANFRSIDVDLDANPPLVRYAVGRKYAPFGFTLSQGQTEIFDLTVTSKHASYTFDIDLAVIVGGQTGTMIVTDDGRPFQVSAATSSAWGWNYGSWNGEVAGHYVQVKAGQRFP
jgi:hypothetical protein